MGEAVTVYTVQAQVDELRQKLRAVSVRLNILCEQFREYIDVIDDMEEEA